MPRTRLVALPCLLLLVHRLLSEVKTKPAGPSRCPFSDLAGQVLLWETDPELPDFQRPGPPDQPDVNIHTVPCNCYNSSARVADTGPTFSQNTWSGIQNCQNNQKLAEDDPFLNTSGWALPSEYSTPYHPPRYFLFHDYHNILYSPWHLLGQWSSGQDQRIHAADGVSPGHQNSNWHGGIPRSGSVGSNLLPMLGHTKC